MIIQIEDTVQAGKMKEFKKTNVKHSFLLQLMKQYCSQTCE